VEAERTRTVARWRQAMAEFRQGVAAINDEIADLNLKVPGPQFQRPRIDPAQEIERMMEESV
jgi:hypothetical protein